MNKIYKFSDFVLDKQSISLYRQTTLVALSSRAFDILSYLIERRGEIVGKDEILERVWSDSFVEEANLPVHISALRRILKEKKGESRFIRTISGRGYSFIAEVEEVAAELNAAPQNRTETAEKKIYSIAVLPFSFAKPSEDNEYLANGVTQSLIADLSKIHDLRVLAYSAVSHYKNSRVELTEIGFLLDADKILTGNISEFKGKWEISADIEAYRGWNASYTYNVRRYIGVKTDVSGYYKNFGFNNLSPSAPVRVSSSIYNFLGGIQIKDNKKTKRFSPFVHALGGISTTRLKITSSLCDSDCNESIPVSHWRLAAE